MKSDTMKQNSILFKLNTVLLVILIGIVLWFKYYPYNPLEVDQPFEILNENKEVCGGDNLVYEVHYTKNTKVVPTLTKSLVDGVIFHLSEENAYAPTTIKLGEEQEAVISLPIPETVPPGNYYLDINAQYKMNSLRTINVDFQSELFAIKDCKDLD